jgi:hypothetical protein
MCRDSLGYLRDDRKYPFASNWSALPICDRVIEFSLSRGDTDLASAAVNFCRENGNDVPGNIKEGNVTAFAEAMIEEGDKKAAIDSVVYAMEQE